MTPKRKNKIWNEGLRRINLWSANGGINQIIEVGILMNFDMYLGMIGYPFAPREPWMKNNKYTRFISDKEFRSKDYEEIITDLFEYAKAISKENY
jgi:hypothetical protein